MSDQYFAVAEGDDDNDTTIVFMTAMLVDVSSAQLEAFKKEGLEMVRSNESVGGMSAGRTSDEEGPVAIFYFSYPYSLSDRTKIEEWLRRHPLVRRIRFEEDVSNKQ